MTSENDLQLMRDAIHAEYRRGLPDAYAGSTAARERAFDRLMERVDAYARFMLAEAIMKPDQPPTIEPEPETTHEPAPSMPARRTTQPARKRSTRK